MMDYITYPPGGSYNYFNLRSVLTLRSAQSAPTKCLTVHKYFRAKTSLTPHYFFFFFGWDRHTSLYKTVQHHLLRQAVGA